MENNANTSLYTTKQRGIILLVIILLLAVLLFFAITPILNAILTAIIFYTLFKPFYLYLHKKRHIGASLSSAIVMLSSFLIIVLPLLGLGLLLVNKIMVFQKDPAALTAMIDKLSNIAGPGFDKKEMLKNGLSDISKWAFGALSVFVNGAVKIFITLLVLYFLLFFMFRSSEEFEATLMKYLPFRKDQSLRLGKELKNVTYSNIFGQSIIGFCQGIIVAVGFLIFSIPDPLFWGVVSVFVCFLPVVGAPIILVPAAIIEIASGHTGSGIGVLIWGMVLVTIVDNLLRQFISKKIADTHPLITIIGVLIGIPVFGLIGLVIGPLLLSYFLLLVKFYEVTYLAPHKIASEQSPAKPDEGYIEY